MRALLMKSKGGGAPITTAGIYWNSKEGIISLSSDGTNWTTIADKNLGATQVYNSGDTLSEANCGKYYQWGNNYGFPFTGAITTSSSQVNASTYGPGNYYSSSTFITSNPRDSSSNANLWGDTTNTNVARQGPCDVGFHVPTKDEGVSLCGILTNGLGLANNGATIKLYLKMPFGGYRYSTYIYSQGDVGYYWYSTYGGGGYCMYLHNNSLQPQSSNNGYYVGMNIRPFKNTPVQPDDGGDWSVLYNPPVPLHFTANTAGSTIKLTKSGSPTTVTLETSTDGINWSTYTIGSTITLSNIGDKLYIRNTSETTTQFSTNGANYYKFIMTGSIAASGDVTSLINKNFTDTVSNNCFYNLFNGCGSLTSAPQLTATILGDSCYAYMFANCNNLLKAPDLPAKTMKNYCYQSIFTGCTSITEPPKIGAETLEIQCFYGMFYGCSNLEKLPKLPILAVSAYAYAYMFYDCSKIKLNTTQTGEYQTPYRIPETGTGSAGNRALDYMFSGTGGTFTGTPTINTTYYTSNTLV